MKKKFLVIRFSSIGDIVLTTPVVRCLKQQVANAEIHYITKKKHQAILEHNPYIDKLHLLDDKLLDTVEELKNEQFDYVIDLHNNIRSAQIKRLLKVKNYSVDKLNIKKLLLVTFKINKLPNLHIVDRYMDTVNAFGVLNDGKGLDYFIPPETENNTELISKINNDYVAIVLAGTYYTKRFPQSKLIELCKATDKPIVLLGGNDEKEMGENIVKACGQHVKNYCGELNLNQSALFTKHARLVITNDTGLMHIAAAFHKKILSIWGNTVPEFGMYPYIPHSASEIMQVRGLNCRPCSKLGSNQCPKRHFKCMMDLSISSMINWIDENY
ncbi:lipopolysaccharide heptosyltransferase family protein [Prolixibacteraceae bacterium JC049]|nr:lipopolysaccharide heptosyltransferase family protein [Prolixibacteraceae bacterium JC049]